jgi:hypothetical protein
MGIVSDVEAEGLGLVIGQAFRVYGLESFAQECTGTLLEADLGSVVVLDVYALASVENY